jgi:23S rRNA pseudouridine2457 synthase
LLLLWIKIFSQFMNSRPHHYFIVHKPFGMVSQFVSTHPVRLLGDLPFAFPEGTHAVGRLDSHSEGLLILTTNKAVTRLLFQSEIPHRRTYIVQVKGDLSEETLQRLKTGIPFRIGEEKYYTSAICAAGIIERPARFAPGATEIPPQYPHTWLQMTLTEGKYHQVRKMVGAVCHPCRRLIRVSIEDLELDDLPPGGVREVREPDFFELLKINGL